MQRQTDYNIQWLANYTLLMDQMRASVKMKTAWSTHSAL